jgi:hypothetical protein
MSPDSWDRSQISRRNDRAIWVLSRSIGAEVISENDALIPQIIGHIPNAVPEGKKGDDATPTFVLLSFLCFLFSFIPTKTVWSRGL